MATFLHICYRVFLEIDETESLAREKRETATSGIPNRTAEASERQNLVRSWISLNISSFDHTKSLRVEFSDDRFFCLHSEFSTRSVCHLYSQQGEQLFLLLILLIYISTRKLLFL